MQIFNHVTFSLSENDMRMVEAIPEGGNWKDIPLNIPSERLIGIRKTGGRTTLYGRLRKDFPSYTITTYFNRPGNGAYIHPTQNRVISAREAARLQSFPDNYVFVGSKTSLPKQIGNAVPPLLAYAIAKEISKQTKTKNVLDLFCGAGGLSLGFELAGFNIVAANDNFPASCESYKKNHTNSVLVEGDITKKEVKEKLLSIIKNKKIDIVVGGPPCQGFSYAGKRMINDPRNFLYKEFVEIVEKVKPKVFLIENVEGILTSNNGETYKSIIDDFSKLGYSLHGQKMHAVEFGVPQKRKRVIIIGTKNGIDPKLCFPDKKILDEKFQTTVSQAISDLPRIIANGGKDLMVLNKKPQSSYQKFMRGEISVKQFLKIIFA
ncbi:DNA (cytosine-5-)-methyltransferase [Candidatus Parcubacteria bacterium]|nr:DNA (cytosine-5-)-methyltransferase [Candidatus Parcubacteria bacterium]